MATSWPRRQHRRWRLPLSWPSFLQAPWHRCGSGWVRVSAQTVAAVATEHGADGSLVRSVHVLQRQRARRDALDAPLLALQRRQPVLLVLSLLRVALQRASAVDVTLWKAQPAAAGEQRERRRHRSAQRKALPRRVAPGCRESWWSSKWLGPGRLAPGLQTTARALGGACEGCSQAVRTIRRTDDGRMAQRGARDDDARG